MGGRNIISKENLECDHLEVPDSFIHFAQQVQGCPVVPVEAMYVVGSVLTTDFVPGVSDINSLIVPRKTSLEFFDFLVAIAHSCKGDGIAPPLVMTREYINSSRDVFPLEFFNFRLLHKVVFGSDHLEDLPIDRQCLRLQCEREIKAKYLWLGQIALETLADRERLVEQLVRSISGYLPLFRAILHLAGRDVPSSSGQLVPAFCQAIGLDRDVFATVLQVKASGRLPAGDEAASCFKNFYQATEYIGRYVDQLPL